jgi:hypothetical protein
LELQEAADDVRTLARLNQLQLKMQSVDSGSGSAYEARMSRVAAAAAGIEERLAKRLELLDGYARVMNMIEIEVEMDTQVCICGRVDWLWQPQETCGLADVVDHMAAKLLYRYRVLTKECTCSTCTVLLTALV